MMNALDPSDEPACNINWRWHALYTKLLRGNVPLQAAKYHTARLLRAQIRTDSHARSKRQRQL